MKPSGLGDGERTDRLFLGSAALAALVVPAVPILMRLAALSIVAWCVLRRRLPRIAAICLWGAAPVLLVSGLFFRVLQ